MSYFLCVDCGGSKTAAVIADSNGNVVGRGHGGPSNLNYLTIDAYTHVVRVAVTEALAAASLPAQLPPTGSTPFVTAWFGVAGADSPAAIKSVLQSLSILVGIPTGPNLIVANDTHLLAAPIHLFDDVSKAVCIIAGTGAIAVSFEKANGQIVECCRSGGWGWILGDEGGGYDVGREAVRHILARADQATVQVGGMLPVQQSRLSEKIMARFNITNPMEIFRYIYLPDPIPGVTVGLGPDAPVVNFVREKRLSMLSPIVFEAAFEDNDPLALEVLRKCAKSLVDTVSVLLGLSTEEKPRLIDPQDAVLSFGGSLVGVERYRAMILEGLKERGHVFKHVLFVDDAAKTGAVALAAAAKKS